MLSNKLTGALILFVFVLLGILSVKFNSPWISSNYYGKYISGNKQEILIRVSDFQIKENWIKLDAEIKRIKTENGKWIDSQGKLLLYLEPGDTTPGFGQIINVNAKIIQIPGPKNPNAFDYKVYKVNNNVLFQSFCRADFWTLSNHFESNMQILANRLRQKLVLLLKDYLGSGQEYAVGSALILGFRDDISEEINNAYIQTGSIHILAVSGLHVGIISGVLSLLLGFIKRNTFTIKLLKLLLILAFLWSFVLIAGAGGSIIRAAVMFSILHIGSMLAKKKYIFNTLAASAFVILIRNPKMLFDVGFLLSYAAVIGIIAIQPLLSNLYKPDNKILKTIWDLSTITIAAQIATLPLVLYYFNQTSLYFLISGILVVPISTIAMYAGIGLFLSNMILPMLNSFIASIMYACLFLMNSIIYWIQNLPGNLIDNISISITEAWLLLISICFVVFSLIYKNKSCIKYAIFSLCLLCGVRCYYLIVASGQKQLVFYSSSKESLIDYYNGRTCISLYSEENTKEEKFIARNNRIAHRIKTIIKCSLDKQVNSDRCSFKHYVLVTEKEKVFFLSKKSEEFYGNSLAENVYVIEGEMPNIITSNSMTKRVFLSPVMPAKTSQIWKDWSRGKPYEIIDLREKAFELNNI